jgi:hypothetical protein
VVQVVAGMRKFTLAMGEKPEKIVAYILEVLGKNSTENKRSEMGLRTR